ncbi:hypothetical protein [Corynebacterium glyciniphilum]|uniref:hypothetical protein n=1 Tax=Corynebacterium glyciniphilum TaxID=1404244 RepID=UPI0011AB647B|nr:hypothetical protein [Corynebacterium glyciniphilum]
MTQLRPGLTRAVLDAHDARRHITDRTVYDDGRRLGPVLGDVFVAPVGSTDRSSFRPLGRLDPDGVTVEPDMPEAPRLWQHAPTIDVADTYETTITLHPTTAPTNFLNLLLGVPAGWLVFKGAHSGWWWSVPDDDHCDGALCHTYREAVDYALEKARTP